MPEDTAAKKEVISWVQKTIDQAPVDQKNLSQWLQGEALEFIMSSNDMPQLWKNWKGLDK